LTRFIVFITNQKKELWKGGGNKAETKEGKYLLSNFQAIQTDVSHAAQRKHNGNHNTQTHRND
jgi:hypothetical protein